MSAPPYHTAGSTPAARAGLQRREGDLAVVPSGVGREQLAVLQAAPVLLRAAGVGPVRLLAIEDDRQEHLVRVAVAAVDQLAPVAGNLQPLVLWSHCPLALRGCGRTRARGVPP